MGMYHFYLGGNQILHSKYKLSIVLSIIIIILAIITSTGGIFIGDLYRDNVLVKSILYPLVLLIRGIFAYIETGTWDTLIPLYILLGAGCVISCGVLFRNINSG